MSRAEYMREYHRQRREEIIAWMGGQCVKCGAFEELQFDHVDPKLKKFEVNQTHQLTLSNPEIVAELMKCQLLCGPCHREKTSGENTVGHGGGVAGVRNCGCDLCRPVKNAYMREWKRKRRIRGSNPASLTLGVS